MYVWDWALKLGSMSFYVRCHWVWVMAGLWAITNHFLRFAKLVTERSVGLIDTLERGILEIGGAIVERRKFIRPRVNTATGHHWEQWVMNVKIEKQWGLFKRWQPDQYRWLSSPLLPRSAASTCRDTLFISLFNYFYPGQIVRSAVKCGADCISHLKIIYWGLLNKAANESL